MYLLQVAATTGGETTPTTTPIPDQTRPLTPPPTATTETTDGDTEADVTAARQVEELEDSGDSYTATDTTPLNP